MQNIYVIGCGGIGCYILERLPMVISSLTLDVMTRGDLAYEKLGEKPLPQLVDRLVLIDGDRFNLRNAVRQRSGAGDKVVQRMLAIKQQIADYAKARDTTVAAAEALKKVAASLEDPALRALPEAVSLLNETQTLSRRLLDEMNSDLIRTTALQGMRIIGARQYVRPDNIGRLIPLEQPTTVPNDDWLVVECDRKTNNLPSLQTPVVFLCVDNKKTRYEVQEHMARFDNCLVINGGNAKVSGHVLIYERRNGHALDPKMSEVYPDITPTADKRPDEVECGAVASTHDQIAITNSIIANFMLAMYVKWVREGLGSVAGNGKRYNEVLIDIDKITLMRLSHPVV